MLVPRTFFFSAGLVLAAASLPAGAQVIFKCPDANGNVTYSQVPCPGGRLPPPVSITEGLDEKNAPPAVDRARIANQARLPEEARQECKQLEVRMRQEELLLRNRDTVTPADEKTWMQSKLRHRELRCG